MKGLSLPILILGLLFVAIGSWFLSNRICGTAGPGFAVKDGKLNTSSSDTYSFALGKSSIKMTDGTNKSFKFIADHLKRNELKTLSLVGTHYAGENGDDLGTARAAAVKNKLVKSFKAPEDRISISGQRVNNRALGKTVPGGVEFIFGGEEGAMEKKTEAATSAADLGIGGLNHTFLFPNSKVNMTLDTEMDNYLSRLKAYLADNPGSRVEVVGYTDNAERESSNLKRSKKMADDVRRFFRNNGIASKAIFAEGKGSADPEVSQDNAEAANLNNRVIMFIKE